MNYSAILLLAGKSTRFNQNDENNLSNEKINKVYYLVDNKPLFSYSLDVFINDISCKQIVVVYNKDDNEILLKYLDKLYSKKNLTKLCFVEGGLYRYESVQKGLNKALEEYVLVHDGARPLINQELINELLIGLDSYDAVSLGLPVTDTIKIKETNTNHLKTLNRDNLYSIQTPQGCKKALLSKALKEISNKRLTQIYDDLQAIEEYDKDITVRIIKGDKKNIKVTNIDDIALVEYYLGVKNV